MSFAGEVSIAGEISVAGFDVELEGEKKPPRLDRLRAKLCGRIDWKFWSNMITILGVVFVGEAARGLVVPSLFLYLEEFQGEFAPSMNKNQLCHQHVQLGGDRTFLGIVVAIFSFGRLFGSIILGYWYNWRGPKEVIIVSLLLSIIGNVLYGFGYITSKWVVLVGRFLVGFGSGILSPVRAAIADITTKEKRVRFMALSNAVQFIGFAIVPGLAALLTLVEFSIGSLKIDKYSSAGFVLTIFNLVALVGSIFFVSTPAQYKQFKEQKVENEEEEEPISRVVLWIGVGLFIMLNLVTRGVLALLETVGAPIFVDVWDSDKQDAVRDSSQVFLALGVGGLVMYIIVDYLRKWIPEDWLLAGSFALTGVGTIFFITWTGEDDIEKYEFLIGAVIIWSIASPIAQTLILSTFSKMLGSRPQGSAMGWIGSAGSIGRIIFPLLAGILSHNSSFITSMVVSFLCALAVVMYRYKMQVREYFLRTVPLQ